MSSETNWGVQHATGFVSDFRDDRDAATHEYQVLVRKGARGIQLVQRRIGPWHRARVQQGGNQ